MSAPLSFDDVQIAKLMHAASRVPAELRGVYLNELVRIAPVVAMYPFVHIVEGLADAFAARSCTDVGDRENDHRDSEIATTGDRLD